MISTPTDIRDALDQADDDALDDLVHDSFNCQASAINNQGKAAQLDYLVSTGTTWDELRDALGIGQ